MKMSLAEVQELEAKWMYKVAHDGDDPRWDWQPMPVADFTNMMSIVRRYELTGNLFLDAGCGIGTKCWMAQHEFAFTAHGIDCCAEYVEQALDLGVLADVCDIMDFENYGAYDVVFFYKPFRDDDRETAWELMLHEAMKPGAVLVAGKPSVKPYSWKCLYKQPWKSIWQKPVPSEVPDAA